MAKIKKYFLIYKGKCKEIAKQQLTNKGVYTIPAPSMQKELGGTDLHFSYEDGGKIQHMKSRKLNYEKEGPLISISSEVFQDVSEQASINDIPEGCKGVIISPLKIQELVNKNTSTYERLGSEYFNLDKFNTDLSQEESVDLKNIDKIPQDKIAFFYTDEYVFYYFNHEWKKIKKEHFYLLKRFEEQNYG